MSGISKVKQHIILKDEGLLEEGHLMVSVMVAFGYRVKEPRSKTRKELSEIVRWI